MILYYLQKNGQLKSCSECREQGLDEYGNCPFLPKEKHNPNIVYNLGQEQFEFCPVPLVDKEAENDLLMANLFWQFGILPQNGGFLEQPYSEITVCRLLASFLSKEMENGG